MTQTIITLANAMFAQPRSLGHGPQKNQHDKDDRLDAARALLGVSPSSVADTNDSLTLFGGRGATISSEIPSDSSYPPEALEDAPRRPRSNSAGLEALAFLATKEQATMDTSNSEMHAVRLSSRPMVPVASAVSSSSSDDDSEAMPPPPPRIVTTTRRRSVSNPEGMEKWEPRDRTRMHFVLPASILEEELAEASAAMKAKEEEERHADPRIDANTVVVPEDEEILDQDELLRRARSRLLEDLSEGSLTGEKGVLTLPHSLAKYKEVYNQNGRIGIYTPSERAAIIARFHGKRNRRVWNKKIRYNCRKNLADRRMRVKGRFVKRSTEQHARTQAPTCTVPTIPEAEVARYDESKDADMPDISDPDAGFCPTDDQPFRRTRRHTIT